MALETTLREALKQQYHAGLTMLAECVQKCPDEMWTQGEYPRTFGRIAFHAAFFTQLYASRHMDEFEPWPGRKPGIDHSLWFDPAYMEPYELPENEEIYTREEILDYIHFVDGLMDGKVDRLPLESEESGFSWYDDIGKLSHQLMNLRHIQGHVGQLSELLMAKGIDTDWVAK